MAAPAAREVRPPRLLNPSKNPQGWWVLEIRGIDNVPDYDPAAFSGMPAHKYRTEVLGDWTVAQGKVVYPEFGSIHIAQEPLPFDPNLPLICGWDFGGSGVTGTPAFVPTQVNTHGQWLIYPGILPDEADPVVGIYDFATWVAQYLRDEFAEPFGKKLEDLKLIHYGDPAGNNRASRTKGMSAAAEIRSCYDIIYRGDQIETGQVDARGNPVLKERKGWGWAIRPANPSLAKRLETMRARLGTILTGGFPAFVVDPNARAIIKALQGGYHFHQRNDGRFELDPQKNHASHCADALGYACLGLFAARPERDTEGQTRWRTTARGPGRRAYV